jgi:hypothetical protein
MLRVRRFVALPQWRRRLWFSAFMTLWECRLRLWLEPFRRVQERSIRTGGSAVHPHDVRWAVLSAARFVPASTCLVEALAAQRLLSRSGLPAVVHFGVSREGAGLEAHAWVESDGVLVVGDHETGRYRELLPG